MHHRPPRILITKDCHFALCGLTKDGGEERPSSAVNHARTEDDSPDIRVLKHCPLELGKPSERAGELVNVSLLANFVGAVAVDLEFFFF